MPNKRKRAAADDDSLQRTVQEVHVDTESESDHQEPVQKHVKRRATIFPGSVAYHDAILISFDSIDITGNASSAESHQESESAESIPHSPNSSSEDTS